MKVNERFYDPNNQVHGFSRSIFLTDDMDLINVQNFDHGTKHGPQVLYVMQVDRVAAFYRSMFRNGSEISEEPQ